MSGPPRRRRWLRLVTPVAVVVTVLIGSTVLYQIEQPDVSDSNYLSPTSTDPIGGSSLADRLAARGVDVRRVTKTSTALVEASSGDTTLFIPAPALVHPFYLRMIKLLPASTGVLLVSADRRALSDARLPATVQASRLAAKAIAPGCRYAPAASAGRAGVFRHRYVVDDDAHRYRCYGGALAVLQRGAAEVTLIGADEPFRNDRIDEHHNDALATGLLAARKRVLWLDLHRLETRPKFTDDPALASQDPAAPSLGPGSPDPDFPIPSGTVERQGPEYDNPAPDDQPAATRNPLWLAFPSWIFAAVALFGLMAVLFALAAGRRLSGPVAEPLPVTVRSTETVEGRGRLYLRAKARGRATETLRSTARQRLAHLLDLPPDPTDEDLVTAVAEHSGWPAGTVEQTLFGSDPVDDPTLVQTALSLEALLTAVMRQTSQPETAASEGDQP